MSELSDLQAALEDAEEAVAAAAGGLAEAERALAGAMSGSGPDKAAMDARSRRDAVAFKASRVRGRVISLQAEVRAAAAAELQLRYDKSVGDLHAGETLYAGLIHDLPALVSQIDRMTRLGWNLRQGARFLGTLKSAVAKPAALPPFDETTVRALTTASDNLKAVLLALRIAPPAVTESDYHPCEKQMFASLLAAAAQTQFKPPPPLLGEGLPTMHNTTLMPTMNDPDEDAHRPPEQLVPVAGHFPALP
jgi:hypothetical protein